MEYISVDAYDPSAGEIDNLGNGTIYIALIKRFAYRLINAINPVNTVNGQSITNTFGAVIPNTMFLNSSLRPYLPIIFIPPEDRDLQEELDSYLQTTYEKTIEDCLIGEFLSTLIAVITDDSISQWDTFARWLRDGTDSGSYVAMLNSSGVEDCELTATTLRGDEYDGGQGVTAKNFSTGADFFKWIDDMLPAEFKDLPVSEIRHQNIDTYYWMSIYVSGLSGTYKSLTSWTDVTIELEIRL